jgi:hypothetical protein
MPKKHLNDELNELERNDARVAEARKRLDDLPEDMARTKRHQEARRLVGRRPSEPPVEMRPDRDPDREIR